MKKFRILVIFTAVFILFACEKPAQLDNSKEGKDLQEMEVEQEKVKDTGEKKQEDEKISKEARYWEPVSNDDVRSMLNSGIDFQVILKTNKGDIKVDLYDKMSPITTTNFLKLARNGYYDDSIFHRYDPGYVVQGGSLYGDGNGGPGYSIPDEHNPELKHKKYMVSMANAGPDTTTSQFFFCLRDCPQLDGGYNILGLVIEGRDVVMKLRKDDKIKSLEILELKKD